MNEKINCKKVILEFLKEHPNAVIAHHFLDATLPEYGKNEFGAYYSSATYHRNFCWLKNDLKVLRENGIELEQLVEGAGKVNKWLIKELPYTENLFNERIYEVGVL